MPFSSETFRPPASDGTNQEALLGLRQKLFQLRQAELNSLKKATELERRGETDELKQLRQAGKLTIHFENLRVENLSETALRLYDEYSTKMDLVVGEESWNSEKLAKRLRQIKQEDEQSRQELIQWSKDFQARLQAAKANFNRDDLLLLYALLNKLTLFMILR